MPERCNQPTEDPPHDIYPLAAGIWTRAFDLDQLHKKPEFINKPLGSAALRISTCRAGASFTLVIEPRLEAKSIVLGSDTLADDSLSISPDMDIYMASVEQPRIMFTFKHQHTSGVFIDSLPSKDDPYSSLMARKYMDHAYFYLHSSRIRWSSLSTSFAFSLRHLPVDCNGREEPSWLNDQARIMEGRQNDALEMFAAYPDMPGIKEEVELYHEAYISAQKAFDSSR